MSAPDVMKNTTNPNQLGPAILGAMEDTCRSLMRCLRRHALVLLGAATLVALSMTLFSAYRSFQTREITILGGPAGGGGIAKARNLAEHLESNASTLWNRNYVVEVESTGGYSENARRIQADRSGRTLGLAHDGFADVDRVAELIPIDKQYLHVICSRKFYAETTGQNPADRTAGGKEVPKLSLVAQALAQDLTTTRKYNHRVYLGPLGSGTRWAAQCVLRQYGVEPDLLVTHGIANWHELVGALNSRAVGLGFLLGKKNAPRVMQLAADDRFIMLSIDHAEAIANFNEHLTHAKFPANSYSSSFCGQELETVTAKRIFACSTLLDKSEAFFLARHIQQALGINEIGWEGEAEGRHGYGLHPGAALLKQQESPRWLQQVDPGNFIFTTVIVTVMLSILTEIARRRNLRQATKNAAARDDTEGKASLPAKEVQQPATTARAPALPTPEQTDDVETVADQLAHGGHNVAQVAQILDYAIFCTRAHDLTEEKRSAFLNLVAKYAEEEPRAQQALAAVMGDADASPTYRLEAIHYAAGIQSPHADLVAALREARSVPSLASAAQTVLDQVAAAPAQSSP